MPPLEKDPQPSGEGRESAGDTARVAGRGGLALTFAKGYFILLGAVQQVVLPRVLGLDGYGRLSSVLSVAGIAYNPIITTSIQGVSRAVAQSSEAERDATVRRTFSIHAGFALAWAGAFFLAAPSVAAFMRAPHLRAALQLMSLVLLFYGLYAPLVGVLNGSKRFIAQASFDVASATLRTAALVAGGLWLMPEGRGVEGATFGFVAVACTIFIAALVLVGSGKPGRTGVSVGAHLGFAAPLFVGQILLNLLLQADLTLLRRFAGEAAGRVGLPATAADSLVGAYRATQFYSLLPYQILVPVTFILFPMLAAAARDGDRQAVARYVKTGMRVAMILAGLLVSVTSGLSGPLLRFVYSDEIAALGTRAMQVLSLGFGTLAILGVLTAVLSSLGRERMGAVLTGLGFGLVVALGFSVTRATPFGEELLLRTAVSTSLALALTTLGAALMVRRVAGGIVGPATLARVLSAVALASLMGRMLPEGGRLTTLLACLGVASAYVALLIASRELGPEDLRTARLVVSRRAG